MQMRKNFKIVSYKVYSLKYCSYISSSYKTRKKEIWISNTLFQSYYSDYYSRYLEDFERRQNGAPSNNDHPVEEPVIHTCENETENIGKNIEAALLMDDILNNGINFCAIM